MAVLIQGGSTVIQSNTTLMSSIVEDGLILYMDPNDVNSYSGTGTAVSNIAPTATSNNVTGTLDASSMYVNPAGAAAYFRVRSDTVIQRLEFSSTITRDTDDDDSTVMFYFWSNYDGSSQYAGSQAFFGGKYTNYFALKGGSGTTYGAEAETNGGTVGNHDYMANESSVFQVAEWQSWTNVVSSAVSRNYYNGVLHNNTYAMNDQSVHSFARLGSNSTGTSSGARGGDIRMGALLIYNRALNQDEINQNLDILNRRFR